MARSQLGGLRRAFMDNKLRNTVSGKEEIDANIEENTIEWNTLYRYNWDIYAEFHLGIPLKVVKHLCVLQFYEPLLSYHMLLGYFQKIA